VHQYFIISGQSDNVL